MKRYFGLLLLGLALLAAPLHSAHYTIDPAHSEISFKVKHLTISKVQGKFDKFSGDFNYDEKNPAGWNANASIDVTSINTGVAARDGHLRSADFFETEKHPAMTFKSTGVTDLANGHAKLSGLLNMHGVEKPVTLDLEVGGTMNDPMGNTRAGFEATGKVNRKDFGIIWNKVLGNGGLVVGEDVDIRISVEGVMDKAPEAPGAGKKPEKKSGGKKAK